MITLAYDGTTLDLTDRLVWVDEFGWSPVQQATAWSTTGALLVDVAMKLAGRPITLDGRPSNAWIERSVADAIAAWAQLPAIELQLVLRGVARAVIFDHEKRGFEAEPLWQLADGQQYSEELMVPVLRFIEI